MKTNFMKRNSSTILTVVGSIGVGITAVMSARDTIKAMKRINKEETENNCTYGTKEKIKLAAPCYIPTVLSGVSTILCIYSANKLNKNIQKSLTSAYVLLDQSYKEYKKSVKEVYGEEGNMNVIKHIADEKVEAVNKEPDTDVFFDFFSLRFFNSTLSAVREAEIAANEMLKMHGYVSLGTVYSFLGEEVRASDELLGWSKASGELYDYDSMKIDVDEVIRDDGSKYYVLDFVDSPTADYLD